MNAEPEDAGSDKPTLSPFERFQSLIRGIVAVPKKEIEAEEAKWHADRELKKKPAVG